jgi:hypothetical protein
MRQSMLGADGGIGVLDEADDFLSATTTVVPLSAPSGPMATVGGGTFTAVPTTAPVHTLDIILDADYGLYRL